MFTTRRSLLLALAPTMLCSLAAYAVDIANAVVLTRAGAEQGEQVAAAVLTEEVRARTGLEWQAASQWPSGAPVVALALGSSDGLAGKALPARLRDNAPEGFSVWTDVAQADAPIVWIVGADARGLLYGVGYLLRQLEWSEGRATLPALDIKTAPEYAIRGHQLGYRARANSWDAWTVEQFDQHIRELALFGVNCIENIPFEDAQAAPLMKVTREEMNRALGRICAKYDLDYWVWTPADFDLLDETLRAQALDKHEAFYKDTPRLDAIFFPGGDPGNNHPREVMPFLEDISRRLAKHHATAKIWISLQGFNQEKVDYFYAWLNEHTPDWLGGVVAGPSSPPIPETRARLDERYGLRHYPDITHTVRSQYPIQWWDTAFALTLNREPINPEPIRYMYVHNQFAPYTNGFLTYSDGVNDDVNKAVFSAFGWDTRQDVRTVLVEYARLFFGADAAEPAADGILALEKNWHGPLVENGAVDGTLRLWQGLAEAHPELSANWRWQMCLFRAYYDGYIRHRLIHEKQLEREANAALIDPDRSADAAMDAALAILQRAESARVKPEWREQIYALAEALFQSVGLQTSVEKYQASGAERGAVLDYVDYPLNNRWWLEDEIGKARGLPGEDAKRAHLTLLATWENPGPGSFYDDIGNVGNSPRVVRGEQPNTDTNNDRSPNPDFMWWDQGMRRVRQSWFSKMDWPLGLRYTGLDPNATYYIRTTGQGQCLLRVDGERIVPLKDPKELGEIKEFQAPWHAYQDGEMVLTFDVPYEPGINWRQASWLNEVWVIKK
jgi:hypothetical protein